MKSEPNLVVESVADNVASLQQSNEEPYEGSHGDSNEALAPEELGPQDIKKDKVRRVNYRLPENAVKLNAAINTLSQNKGDPNAPQDIRHVAKMFKIPYNTLRDNYLKQTVGELVLGKRTRKQDNNRKSLRKNNVESL